MKKAEKNKQQHLPLYGVGPVYVSIILILTAASILLSVLHKIPSVHYGIFYIPVVALGVMFIIFGVILWIKAFGQSKIQDNIIENKLATNGVYALVRNPIYTAFMFICLAAVLFSDNIFLLSVPVFNWAFLSVFMKCTEEKWLYKKYGNEYLTYCKNTNRCIPWFPKKRG